MNCVLDPTPLTRMGDRPLDDVDDSDTAFIWDALQKDLPFAGLSKQGVADVVQGHDRLRKPQSKKEYIWHTAEWRTRLPGGFYFGSRYILDYTRMIRRVHDKQFGRRFEDVPGSKKRVFLLCHRDSYKSTFTGVSTPISVLGVRPWERILLSGASDDDTSEMLNAITGAIEQNPKVLATWPHLDKWRPAGGRPKKWGERAILIKGYYGEGIRDPREGEQVGEALGRNRGVSRREVSIMVCGAEKSPTRLHPTLWIFDDLINLINSQSTIQVAKVLRFVREVLGNLGAGRMPTLGSGTMWRRDDIAALILDGEIKRFDVFKMPVGVQNDDGTITWNMPREEVLAQMPSWEEPDMHCGFDQGTFDDITGDLQPYEIACQYWCDPTAVRKQSFDIDTWREYDDAGPTAPYVHLGKDEDAFARWVDPMFIFGVIDLASTISRTAKYTACFILGIDDKKRIWILDGVYDKMEPWMQHNMLMQLFLDPRPDEPPYWEPRPLSANSSPVESGMCPTAWRPDFMCIEKTSNSGQFKGGFKVREHEDGFGFPWHDVQVQGTGEEAKLCRILDKLSMPFQQRRFRMRRNVVKPSHFTGGIIDVTEMLRREHSGWSDRGVPVDGMDALSLGAEWYTVRGKAAPSGATQDEVEHRAFAERMLDGILSAATAEEAAELGIKEGDVIPVSLEEDFLRVDIDPDWS